MKKWLLMLFLLAGLGGVAAAYPVQGQVGNRSDFDYDRLTVDDSGNVSLAIRSNSTDDVIFHGRVVFLGDVGDTSVAETHAIAVKIHAKEEVEVVVKLRSGTPASAREAPRLAWSEVHILESGAD